MTVTILHGTNATTAEPVITGPGSALTSELGITCEQCHGGQA